MEDVFVSGGTGYLGRRLIAALAARGHRVRSLARPGSEHKLPTGCEPVNGDALVPGSFTEAIPPSRTFVHLTGTPKPAPWKEKEFRAIDLVSLRASVDAAVHAGTIRHFIYVSVAHPAPVMRAYIKVRREGEDYLRRSELPRTILRPWYVLGPGHRWPSVLKPLYALASLSERHREAAERLGLITIEEMTTALVHAVEHAPDSGERIVDTRAIRQAR